jgi:hypothetical protein
VVKLAGIPVVTSIATSRSQLDFVAECERTSIEIGDAHYSPRWREFVANKGGTLDADVDSLAARKFFGGANHPKLDRDRRLIRKLRILPSINGGSSKAPTAAEAAASASATYAARSPSTRRRKSIAAAALNTKTPAIQRVPT